jgi:putative DNA primase/helicase
MLKIEVNEHGVWWTPPKKPKSKRDDEDDDDEGTTQPKPVWIAPPIHVEATVRNVPDDDHHGQYVRFKNQDGIEKTCTLELSELAEGNDAITKLLNLGFKPSLKRTHLGVLKEYLYKQQPGSSICCVPSHGWHGNNFIETDHYELREGSKEPIYILDPTTAHGHRYNTAGTLEEWRESVARLCDKNSRPALAICAAFAAPLLHLVKAQNIGLHFRGISSTGKTTTLFASGSVWGGSEEDNNLGFVESWRATANGLELQCLLHNDSLLCLDEISLVNDREIGDIVYSLGNGTGKRRATRDIKARPVIHFRLVFLSCGERSLSEMMESTGKRVRGGQESRLIDIPADAGKGYGIYETLHGHPDGATLSNCLMQAAKTCYGTAGRAWIDYLFSARGK